MKRTNNQKNAKHSKSGLIAFVANNFKYILATIAIIIAIIAVFFGESKLIFSDTKSANVNFNILYYRNVQTEERFLTLADAVANAESLQNSGVYATNTIQVINGGTETTAVTIPAGKNIVLDLNGKDITLNNVSITNNGTLTITDETETHTRTTNGEYELNVAGTITSSVNTIINNGTMNVQGNVEINGTGASTHTIDNYANLTVTSGTISSTNYGTIRNGEGGVKAKTTISGGTIISSRNATILNVGILSTTNDNSPLTENILISGSTKIISEGNKQGYAIFNNSATGKVKITGGEITSTGTVTISSGENSDAVANHSTGTIEITGGKIESKTATGVASANGNVTITGGEIVAETYGMWIYNGIVTVGSEDNSKELKISANRGDGILNNYANVTILSGTIESKTTNAAMAGVRQGATGTITLGTNEATPSVNTTAPSIIGMNTIGLKVDSGTFNFYDGIIIGPTRETTISGNISAVPAGYQVVYGTEKIGQTIYKTAYLGSETVFDFNEANNMNKWNYIYPERFNVTYNSSTRMNDISITGASGYEVISIPIQTENGKTYKISFDYKNNRVYTALQGTQHRGIAYQILGSAPINNTNIDRSIQYDYLPTEVTEGRYELEFEANRNNNIFSI